MTLQIILNILINNKKQILTVTLISTIIFTILNFVVSPVSYNAEVTLLPPTNEEQSSLGNLLSGGGSDLTGLLSLGGSRSNSLLNAEILKSRSVSEDVIKYYNLFEYFDTKNIHLAASKLQKIISVDVSKEGILRFSVNMETGYFGRFTSQNDSIKYKIAKIANKFVEYLDKVNNEKVNIKAKSSRIFVEKQLLEIKVKLDSSEQKLKEFQKQNKTVSLNEQLAAAIENAAKLKSEIVATEIQISSLKYSLSDESQTIQNMNKKLGILKDQYNKFDTGIEGESDYLPAFSNVPEIIKEYAELTRDVKIFNEVYLFLQKQYFKESLQENKNVNTVQILDPAITPIKNSGPSIVVNSFLFGVFMFLLMVLINIYKEKKKGLK
ncbi:MAG TPA: GNVR domain-containing protein [Melioribacteraceae bacterium]|nr:GNVR domain-containing protein [Melioribacteraceae bacterium]